MVSACLQAPADDKSEPILAAIAGPAGKVMPREWRGSPEEASQQLPRAPPCPGGAAGRFSVGQVIDKTTLEFRMFTDS